jgi:hypothetical protein
MLTAVATTNTNISSAKTAVSGNANGNNSPNPLPNQTSLPLGQTKQANPSSSSANQNVTNSSTTNTSVSQPTSQANANNSQGIQDQLASKNTVKEEPKGFDKFVKYIKDHWKEFLVGIAGIGLLIWGGITLSKRPKESGETKSSNTDNSLDTNTPSSRTLTKEERLRLAKQAVQDGNFGLHCQTMAPLNALRILKAWGDPRGVNLDLATIKRKLESGGKEALSQHNWLADGSMISAGETMNMMPSIIFDLLKLPYGEYDVKSQSPSTYKFTVQHNALLQLLKDLHAGKVGTFSYGYKYPCPIINSNGRTSEYGGHVRTVYGFSPGSSYSEFSNLMTRKANLPLADFEREFNQLLPQLGKIHCYEQDNSARELHHHDIPISELLDLNGHYLYTKFTIIDGNPKERDITLTALTDSYAKGAFDQVLLPNARNKFRGLTEEEKLKYFLSRAHDFGVPPGDDLSIFNPQTDYILAV